MHLLKRLTTLLRSRELEPGTRWRQRFTQQRAVNLLVISFSIQMFWKVVPEACCWRSSTLPLRSRYDAWYVMWSSAVARHLLLKLLHFVLGSGVSAVK